ncbi:MAG: FAD-binding protein [Rhodopila sp.]|nr:FAD-binding protein [Rhodopila sp.]
MTRYDFIVVGSGPAGRRAAIQAAKLGRSVLVVEKGRRVAVYQFTPALSPPRCCAKRS